MPENNLVIGWADTVTILKIRDDDGVKKGEVHHIFHVSMFICGISYIPESGIDNMELFLVGLQLEGEDFDDCAVRLFEKIHFCSCHTIIFSVSYFHCDNIDRIGK